MKLNEAVKDYYKGKRILVTGCASFIGSHLCRRLREFGADVFGIDDLSSGKIENIQDITTGPNCLKFYEGDLFNSEDSCSVFTSVLRYDVVFHLAATHGGRGFVDKQQYGCSTNFALDNLVFQECVNHKVGQIVFASSGCVYPTWMQNDTSYGVYLRECDVPDLYYPTSQAYRADMIYGWAKLMAEFTLQAISKEFGIKTTCCRYFTAYGPNAKEDHAVMAMIGRAFLRKNPFDVWGDGTQIRNWTYVDDIVDGTLLAACDIFDGTGVNVGTTEATTVLKAAQKIIGMVNSLDKSYSPNLNFLIGKPTGPLNRVASDDLIRSIHSRIIGEPLQWKSFDDGVWETIKWYFEQKRIIEVERLFESGDIIEGRKR